MAGIKIEVCESHEKDDFHDQLARFHDFFFSMSPRALVVTQASEEKEKSTTINGRSMGREGMGNLLLFSLAWPSCPSVCLLVTYSSPFSLFLYLHSYCSKFVPRMVRLSTQG